MSILDDSAFNTLVDLVLLLFVAFQLVRYFNHCKNLRCFVMLQSIMDFLALVQGQKLVRV